MSRSQNVRAKWRRYLRERQLMPDVIAGPDGVLCWDGATAVDASGKRVSLAFTPKLLKLFREMAQRGDFGTNAVDARINASLYWRLRTDANAMKV